MTRVVAVNGGLGDPSSTRLLVDRIVACWLQLQSADIAAIQTQSGSLKLLEFYERRRSQAHRRFLSAVKMLATVRKLALPVLQLNVARNQVNVAGGIESPEIDTEPRRSLGP